MLRLGFFIILLLGIFSRAEASRKKKHSPPPPSQPAVEAVEINSNVGNEVIGKVHLEKLFPPKKVSVTKSLDKCGKEKADETYVYGASKGLKNVVVWIEGMASEKDVKPSYLVLENITCTFVPHVSAAVVGSTLEIKNFDPLAHNNHAFLASPAFGMLSGPRQDTPENMVTLFNVALPTKGVMVKRKLEKTGLAEIKNDAGYDWMHAYIRIFDHPYFAVTNEEGEFRIPHVSAGEYDLHSWHEGGGEKAMHITVSSSGLNSIDIVY